jgi:2'-hydroxyisoflavone reductase
MRLLVLGGTRFLGRALVEAALAERHEVTLFNRGLTNPGLFPEVEHLHGDREGDLSALEGRDWDGAIDVSVDQPRIARSAAELLRDAVGHYTFISSISAYGDLSRPPREGDPVASSTGAEPDPEDYGALKAGSERAVMDVFDKRALLVRPGLIVGPHDPSGRFAYWPHRIGRGGEVLAPGSSERRVQLIDVRDLGEWIVRAIADRITGLFNATGPVPELMMGALLDACRDVTASDARFVWVSDDFLREQEVGEWMELPLWLVDPAFGGMLAANVSRAVAAGLTFRPLADTIAATLEHAATVDGVGLSAERERELLAAWDAG